MVPQVLMKVPVVPTALSSPSFLAWSLLLRTKLPTLSFPMSASMVPRAFLLARGVPLLLMPSTAAARASLRTSLLLSCMALLPAAVLTFPKQTSTSVVPRSFLLVRSMVLLPLATSVKITTRMLAARPRRMGPSRTFWPFLLLSSVVLLPAA